MKKIIYLFVAAIICSSCASSRLKIEVHILDIKTKTQKLWTMEDVAASLEVGTSIGQLGEQLATDKQKMADAIQTLSNCYYTSAVGLRAGDLRVNDSLYTVYRNELRFFQEQLARDFTIFKQKTSRLGNVVQQAETDPETVLRQYTLQDSVLALLLSMKFNLISLTSPPLTGDFEKIEYGVPKAMVESIEANASRKNFTVPECAVSAFLNLQRMIGELEFASSAVVKKAVSDLDAFKGAVNRKTNVRPTAAASQVSLDKLTNAYQDPTAVPQLSRLQSLLEAQRFRTEDLSDPFWKTVVAAGKKHWRLFTKTKFRAEGNSSVVIVKDDPTTFRIQQGSNNPAALVQAQMKIVRATADASIKIASAYMGLPITTPASSDDSDGGEASTTPAESTVLTDRSAIDDSDERRLQFREELMDIMAQLEKPNADKAKLQNELMALLKTYQLKYE